MDNVCITEKPNINRGRPYEQRVCINCKGKCRDLSNYCQPCFNLLKKSLIEYLDAN